MEFRYSESPILPIIHTKGKFYCFFLRPHWSKFSLKISWKIQIVSLLYYPINKSYVSYFHTGTILSSVILSKLLKVHDALIGIISAFWDSMVALCYTFVVQNWQLYLSKIFFLHLLMYMYFLKVSTSSLIQYNLLAVLSGESTEYLLQYFRNI